MAAYARQLRVILFVNVLATILPKDCLCNDDTEWSGGGGFTMVLLWKILCHKFGKVEKEKPSLLTKYGIRSLLR